MKAITPADIHPPFANYAHGVEVPANQRIIRTSGQLGVAPGGDIPNGAYEQAVICFANIRAILEGGGMTTDDVIHISAFVTDRSHMGGYMQARDAFIVDTRTPPASTLLIVSGFTRPEFKVEVEVMAAAE